MYLNSPSPLIQAAVTAMTFQKRHNTNPAQQNYFSMTVQPSIGYGY